MFERIVVGVAKVERAKKAAYYGIGAHPRQHSEQHRPQGAVFDLDRQH
jgi:hypothetical protein